MLRKDKDHHNYGEWGFDMYLGKLKLSAFLLFLLVLQAGESTAQIFDAVTPLKATFEEMEKLDVEHKLLNDGRSVINTERDQLIITYYKNGCDESVEKRLGLRAGSVVQVRFEKKYRIATVTFILGSYSLLERVPINEEKVVYIDHRSGWIVFSRLYPSPPDMEETFYELVDSSYYVPKSESMEPCLFQLMDDEVRDALNKSKSFRSLQPRK